MIDTNKLQEWIDNHGYKLSFIASKMGISSSSLSKKIKGSRKFKCNEAYAFRSLGMSLKELESIFFATM